MENNFRKRTIIGGMILIITGLIMLLIQTKEPQVKNSNKPTIKIGVIYPMSGDGAIYGIAAKDTTTMFFDEFNKQDRRFNYEIIFEDNQLKLPLTAMLANRLIQVNKVDVLVTCLSNFGAVVSPIAENYKTLHFSVATDPTVANGFYNFMASSNIEGEVKLLYDTLLKHNARKVDIVVVNATGPISMVNYFKDIVAQEKGLKINNTYSVNANEKDFRILISKIKNNNPDYVILMLAMPTIDIFLKQYKENNANIPVTGIETFTYLQNKKLADGMWYIDTAPATDDFAKRYETKTGRNTTDYAEYMDLVLQMITLGYEGTNSTDKVKVAEYVQKYSNGMSTAIGTVSTKTDGIIDGEPILKKVENGKIVDF